MNRYSFSKNSIMISMTESRLHTKNTHSDAIPVSDQFMPSSMDEEDISKELDIPPMKSSNTIARRVVTIALCLISMVAIVYPMQIIPGTMIIILPIEIVLVDRIYGEIVRARKLVSNPREDLVVKDTPDSSMEKKQIRVSVYGKRSPN
jgi:hypothetical protein